MNNERPFHFSIVSSVTAARCSKAFETEFSEFPGNELLTYGRVSEAGNDVMTNDNRTRSPNPLAARQTG